jgi:hypothetical protein
MFQFIASSSTYLLGVQYCTTTDKTGAIKTHLIRLVVVLNGRKSEVVLVATSVPHTHDTVMPSLVENETRLGGTLCFIYRPVNRSLQATTSTWSTTLLFVLVLLHQCIHRSASLSTGYVGT